MAQDHNLDGEVAVLSTGVHSPMDGILGTHTCASCPRFN